MISCNFGHGTTHTHPFGHILKRCCPSQRYILVLWKFNLFPQKSIPHPILLFVGRSTLGHPKNVHRFNIIRFYFWIPINNLKFHLNLPYQFFANIYQNVKERNSMPTRHYLQVCFPMPTCSNISNSLKLGFPLNPFASLLIILAQWLVSMVGDHSSRWMGYRTTNIKMWPQPKKLQNIPSHMNFIWHLLGH